MARIIPYPSDIEGSRRSCMPGMGWEGWNHLTRAPQISETLLNRTSTRLNHFSILSLAFAVFALFVSTTGLRSTFWIVFETTLVTKLAITTDPGITRHFRHCILPWPYKGHWSKLLSMTCAWSHGRYALSTVEHNDKGTQSISPQLPWLLGQKCLCQQPTSGRSLTWKLRGAVGPRSSIPSPPRQAPPAPSRFYPGCPGRDQGRQRK